MKKQQILLDMDGVLCDFFSGAIKVLNKAFDRDYDMNQYATEFGKWETYDYYGLSTSEFWSVIEKTPDFWYNLQPMPWASRLYSYLLALGEVTVVTSPSLDPSCAMQKLQWLKEYLNIGSDGVFIGSRKYLMAGNGVLIDDYYKNVDSFVLSGGDAVLVPSNWNTPNLTYDKILSSILDNELWLTKRA